MEQNLTFADLGLSAEVFFQGKHELLADSPVPAGRVHNQLADMADVFAVQTAPDGADDAAVFRILEEDAVPRLFPQMFQGLFQRRDAGESKPLRHFSEGE